METLDLLGPLNSTFAGHFAPDDHNHRHNPQAQHQVKQQCEQATSRPLGESLNQLLNQQQQHHNQFNLTTSQSQSESNSKCNSHKSRQADHFEQLDQIEANPSGIRSHEVHETSCHENEFLDNTDCIRNTITNSEGEQDNKMQYSSELDNDPANQVSECELTTQLSDQDDAFIAFCADSSSVLNNHLNKQRYHINKLYQPLGACGQNHQRLVCHEEEAPLVEHDDEFLLYQELKGLSELSERCELSKILEDDDDRQRQEDLDEDSLAASNRLAHCADLLDQDSLELTNIIDSIEAFESGGSRASPLLSAFHSSVSPSTDSRATPDKPDSSGRGNERSPVSNYGPSEACFSTINEADCFANQMQLDHQEQQQRQHQELTSNYFSYQSELSSKVGESREPMQLLIDTPTSQPSTTCEPSVYQDSRSETSSVVQTTSLTPVHCEPVKKASATSGRRRGANVNHYRRRTANARERIRMREINQAFEKLKKVVPIELVREASEAEAASERLAQEQQQTANGKRAKTDASSESNDSSPKLTKITTLRLAVSYISKLSSLLNENPESCSTSLTSEQQSQRKKSSSKAVTGAKTSNHSKKEGPTKTTKRRSRTNISKKPASASDNKNKKVKNDKSSSTNRSHGSLIMKFEDSEPLKNSATPPSIVAFNDANGFKRIDNNDVDQQQQKVHLFENGAQLKVQQPVLLADSALFNRMPNVHQQQSQTQTAYIAIPQQQNQKQQYLTTYQPGQQHHSMISQTQFNQSNQDRLLVAPVPVAILVSNLVYINPMRQGVRQQQPQNQPQQQFCILQNNQSVVGSQQPQNGSNQQQQQQQQILAVKHLPHMETNMESSNSTLQQYQINNQHNNQSNIIQNDPQIVPVSQSNFCQTKFVAVQPTKENQGYQLQQQQQGEQQLQISNGESLESNINKLVASLATTSPSSGNNNNGILGDSQQQQSNQLQQNHQQPAAGNQQQPIRTYRFHNYDGNIRI